MKTITIKEGCPNPVALGEKGENGVSAVLFDYSEWISDFGEGAISLLVKRKGDTAAYPVVLSTADGIATWTISDIDTAVQGYGKAEYVFTIDDKIAKSAVFSFFVAHDLGPAGDPPDPYESWIDTLTALGGETLVNAQRAEAAESGAEAAQTAAETAATNAATSATTAQTAASDAQQSATNAATSVTQSANNAAQAIEAASDAEEADRMATASAQSASASATSAATSAQSASQSATQASNSATNAASSATSASGSASAAATSESNAAQSATDAEASAQEAATEAAKLNNYLPTDTASGAIASFSDGADDVPVEALSVALEPIQDLNGQTSPYPAGGGVNKLNPAEMVAYGSVYGFAITVDGDDVVVSGTYTGSLASPQFRFLRLSDQSEIPYNMKGFAVDSATASHYNGFIGKADGNTTLTIQFNNCVQNETYTFRVRIVAYEGDTAPTAWSPYENICPITGHTQCEVWRAGSNLIGFDDREQYAGADFRPDSVVDFSKSYVYYGIASSGYCFANNVPSDVVISSDNCVTFTPRYDWYGVGFNIPIKGGATYSSNANTISGYAIGVAFYDADSKFISTTNSRTFTAPSNAVNAIVVISARVESGTVSAENVRVVFGNNTSAEYEPPSIVHISIPLGQTVFGGTVDVVQGVLTVDRAMVDLGSLTWNYASGSAFNLRSTTDIGALPPANTTTAPNAVSSVYPVLSYLGVSDADKSMTIVFATSRQAGKVWVHDTSYSDAETFKSAVTGQQLVYELATPIEIQLTANELTTLLGTNNIWSDSGDVDVTYRADIQKYITKVISEALV